MPRLRRTGATAVIDTSCLLNLLHLNLISKTVLRYDAVYIPQYVFDEVTRRWHHPDELRKLLRHYTFLKKCSVGEKARTRLLYDRKRNPGAPIHQGEAEAIVQATERRVSDVLIDERAGTRIAHQHSLNVKSTLELLKDFKRTGIVPEIKSLIAHLRSPGRSFWLSDSVVNRALEDVDEN
jgi:predicted nucleic acid-binding protein